jgi:hypothetical protein
VFDTVDDVEEYMGYDETTDILALAEVEEADQSGSAIDADPLGFKWGLPPI